MLINSAAIVLRPGVILRVVILELEGLGETGRHSDEDQAQLRRHYRLGRGQRSLLHECFVHN